MSEHVETLPAVSAPNPPESHGGKGDLSEVEDTRKPSQPVRPSDVGRWCRAIRDLTLEELDGKVGAGIRQVVSDLMASDRPRDREAGAKIGVAYHEAVTKRIKAAGDVSIMAPELAAAGGAGGSSIETVIRVVQEQRRIEHIPPAGQTGN